ncbi:hypothetical protein [Fibrella forsythiae]|uniref:Uncharacterized protein n=1 Tax=Fibrella forsythiae TaxID=2817061 RepID=A0ABS3JHB9_9BACT|nr:hypothetical protein [Fibrella forsythiae]MBO0949405.1 hypothetical protein [Fibrella forsythiae]
MDNLPIYIYLVFGLTVLVAVGLFYQATQRSKTFLVLAAGWLLFQAAMSLSGFYTVTNTTPPRVSLLLLPPLVMTIVLFTTTRGQRFIDTLNLNTLTLFHIIRVPVELVLYWLFVQKAVPELMTFEGRNVDILSGISAPIIYYLYFTARKVGKPVLIGWNVLCLGLLINIVTNAILSLPSVFQQFAFDQPNVAILYFPFILLPGLLVPLVLFSHLASFRQLLITRSTPATAH